MMASGNLQATNLVNDALLQLDLDLSALYSTLGRTLARNLETKIFSDALCGWHERLVSNIESGDLDTFNDEFWDPLSWPSEARGVGLVEAPRGALSHYIIIENGKISNYQAVVPTTWNGSPRDAFGQGGAMEQALLEHKVYDREQPLELLRTIHTFDPCIACAVHMAEAKK
jgi:hydrogenase large subunit